jgi:hypothetical protein
MSRRKSDKKAKKRSSGSDSSEEFDQLEYFEEIEEEEEEWGILEIMLNLCKMCEHIYKLHMRDNSKEVRWNRENTVLKTLKRYRAVVEQGIEDKDNEDQRIDAADVIIQDLLRIYGKNQEYIVTHNENWLISQKSLDSPIKSKKVRFIFPSGKKASQRNARTEPTVQLSTFYRNAVELQIKHQSDPIPQGCKFNPYAALPLRLQRWFYLAFEQAINLDIEGDFVDDTERISGILDTICKVLGIDDKTFEEDFSMSPFGGIFSGLQKSFKIIVGKVMDSAARRGIEIPENLRNLENFNMDSVNDFFSTIMSSDTDMLSSLIEGTLPENGDLTNPSSLINTLLDRIEDDDFANQVNQALGKEFDFESIRTAVRENNLRQTMVELTSSVFNDEDIEQEETWEV